MLSTIFYATGNSFDTILKLHLKKHTQLQMQGSSSILFLDDFFENRNSFLKIFMLYQNINTNVIVIGYALYQMVDTECELITILIIKEFHNQKYGQYLLQQSIRQLQEKKASICFLEVRKSNISAIKCYEKIGFTTIYTRKNYYSVPTEDGLIMQMQLLENQI